MRAQLLIESQWLLEKDGKREYSCVMVPVPQELADLAIAWAQANVSKEDLFIDEDGGKGLESAGEYHTTAFYGLLMKEPDEHLMAIFGDTEPFEVSLGNVSLFKNEEYDVLKLDVESPGLELLNARIAELPNENEFKKFVPHATLAYVKKDTCDHLVGKKIFDDAELSKSVALSGDGAAFVADSVVFSNPDSEKTKLMLGQENAVSVTEGKKRPNSQRLRREYSYGP